MSRKGKTKLEQLYRDGGINSYTYNSAMRQIEELIDDKIKEKEKENSDNMIAKIQLVIHEMFPNGYELVS